MSIIQKKASPASIIDAGYKFVKSIHTSDSKLFNIVVEKDSLKKSLQDFSKDEIDLNQVPIMDMYFYMYSPQKIRSQDLDSLRKSEFPFEQVNFKILSQSEHKTVLLVESFNKNKSGDTVEITVVKFKAGWKVTSAIPR